MQSDYLRKRRERVAMAWDLSDEFVLVGAGEAVPILGAGDQQYPFISHAEYFYLTDQEVPGGVVAYDPKEGWSDFAPEVSEAERVWEGREDAKGTPLTQLGAWIAARRGRPLIMLGAPLPCTRSDPGRTAELREMLTHVRRPKDDVELERMRRANAASAAGFEVARAMIREGVSERDVQIEMEAAFFRAGGDRTAYGTIVGTGSNAAVLHFTPTRRKIRAGEAVLIDAGAEIGRYASDVTRTYQAGAAKGSARFGAPAGAGAAGSNAGGAAGDAGLFRALYEVVLRAQKAAIERCRANVEFREVHMAAARDLAEGLTDFGVLRGKPDALVEQDAHALFFPHGLGHMVGLGVRDASGYLPGRKRSTRPGLSALRTDLPLLPGYVMTIEPGVYFIPPLLNDPQRRAKYRDAVNWAKVDALLEFGGIRIEDNVLVTNAAPEVLTAGIPKE